MKLFVLLSRVPYPTEKGDKLRAFHQIRCLSEHHEITLCALEEGTLNPDALSILGKYCKAIHILPISRAGMFWNVARAFFNGNPFQTGYFFRKTTRNDILRIIQEVNPDHIYCQLIRTAEYVKEVQIPKTIDYQDVLSMGIKRRMETAPWWMKPVFAMEYRRLIYYEREVFDRFDRHTIISAPDRDLIPHPERKKIHIIPNGVDFHYFTPQERAKVYDIVFTGNMGYPPNVDAASFLALNIFPLVQKEVPGVKLLLAGANPHPRIRNLHSGSVTVSGWVNDIRDSYSTSKVFIAPMRIGTGLQNKLLEAMAMNLPCITSNLANAALDAKTGVEILVGSNAKEYADHIIYLLRNPESAQQLAQKGHEYVKRTYNWENTSRLLSEIFMNNDINNTESRTEL